MGVPRKFSSCDIYHVTSKGVGGQIIFEDDADRRHFLRLLKDACVLYEIKVAAWCLMDNHFHLLLHAPIDDISLGMKRLKGLYARDYNNRYKRSGHLFQAVFASFPIDDESYFAAAVRYIHNNPVRSGIVNSPSEYRWSSYQEYFGNRFLVHPSLMLDLGCESESSLDFDDGSNATRRLMYCGARVNDADAVSLAKSLLGISSPALVGGFPRAERDEAIVTLSDAGLYNSQISRLTGVSDSSVRRAINVSKS